MAHEDQTQASQSKKSPNFSQPQSCELDMYTSVSKLWSLASTLPTSPGFVGPSLRPPNLTHASSSASSLAQAKNARANTFSKTLGCDSDLVILLCHSEQASPELKEHL